MTSQSPGLTVRYGIVDSDYVTRLATRPPEQDGPVWMVNLMSYRDKAEYADGRETTLTGREADDRYAPVGPLAEVGGRVVLFAEVESQPIGSVPKWDRVAVVRYPSRRAFVEMQSLPEFAGLHEHKDAAMAQSIVLGCLPEDAGPLGDLPDWAEVPNPPTEADGPVVVCELYSYRHSVVGREAPAYPPKVQAAAVPHGARPAAWFTVEGIVVGDGRSWDRACFTSFPSRAAFMAVVLNPDRLASHTGYREALVADTYTMLLRPSVNNLAASLLD